MPESGPKSLTKRELYHAGSKKILAQKYKKDEETIIDEVEFVNTMLSDIPMDLESVPRLAIKYCCYHGKTQTLTRIFEQFPHLNHLGIASKTAQFKEELD